MCCGIPSKEVTATARKAEEETTGAKQKKEKEKIPLNSNTEKDQKGRDWS